MDYAVSRGVLASSCSRPSGIMGIMVIDSLSSAEVSVWVFRSLRSPTHIIVHPIIQRRTAAGTIRSLISLFRMVFHLLSFWVDDCVVFWWSYSFYEVMICIWNWFLGVLYISDGFWVVVWLF
jgi:hypothetical protein